MNKILLALSILGAGAAGLSGIRQSTIAVQRRADLSRETWIVQTQIVATIQNDQSQIIAKVSELKQALAQAQPVVENPLWSALQTNRPGHLPPEIREHLLEELGYKWSSPEDFIVVSKDTLRDMWLTSLSAGRRIGKLDDVAGEVLVITPEQRGLVEAAAQRVHADFRDWASSHTVRTEPKGDIVAQYTLENDPAMSVSNNFFRGVLEAVGRDRAELIVAASPGLMNDVCTRAEYRSMIVRRSEAGNQSQLRVELYRGQRLDKYELWQSDSGSAYFPEEFHPLFPNGWADVAKREGFEIPTKPPKQ